jgi:hypothetical protein
MNNRNDEAFDGKLAGGGRRDANNAYTRMEDRAAQWLMKRRRGQEEHTE